MSEKCYYINEEIEEDDDGCSRNNGYSGSPDACDDCEEYFCSKHLKKHKKDGYCIKIQAANQEEHDEATRVDLEDVSTEMLEEELARRKGWKK